MDNPLATGGNSNSTANAPNNPSRPILKPKSRLPRVQNAPMPNIPSFSRKESPLVASWLSFPGAAADTTPNFDDDDSPSPIYEIQSPEPPEVCGEIKAPKTGILDLPLEILHQIGLKLPFAADVFFLSFTCRRLYAAFSEEQNYFWYRRGIQFLSIWSPTGKPQMATAVMPTLGYPCSYFPVFNYRQLLQEDMSAKRGLGERGRAQGTRSATCNVCCQDVPYKTTLALDAFGKQHCMSCYRILELAKIKDKVHQLHPRLDVCKDGAALHPYLSSHGRQCKLTKAMAEGTLTKPLPSDIPPEERYFHNLFSAKKELDLFQTTRPLDASDHHLRTTWPAPRSSSPAIDFLLRARRRRPVPHSGPGSPPLYPRPWLFRGQIPHYPTDVPNPYRARPYDNDLRFD
ncbi:hypothetical protein BJ508DRAFT_366718 [Ascobolus immersus RN42]|uniref:F-box domain-containing protein n=1 Tax=Ascobolus immersus RN42 TaxID=1160509 RepID=A0A3N4HLW6_ASCIM|nr:hypothetical protein BJ508DRAFT_366718 [Ascobolus immersus RN42]